MHVNNILTNSVLPAGEKAAPCSNDAQSLAIQHASGPLQVLAGPGSGKTYLTIRRVRHLICHHGVSPKNILVITFTKAAALEMQQRFFTLTKGRYQDVHFGTFHAVYYQILKQSGYGNGHNPLSLVSPPDQYRYLKHVLNEYGIKDADRELMAALLREISRRKNGLENREIGLGAEAIWPAEAGCTIEELFPRIFEEYCSIMKEENKLDFDDMILVCSHMLEENERALHFWQQQFSHILVDEFQDIGVLQYRVLKKLAAPENNLFVVGDDDQSIYGFRGAGADVMKQFLTDYPQAEQLTLSVNYRSTRNIVKASSLLISDNKNRFRKSIKAAGPEGAKIKLRAYDTKEKAYCHMAEAIKKMSAKEQSETAVICRTNHQTAAIARVFSREKAAFSLKDGTAPAGSLFRHPVAKDLLAYLNLACGSFSATGENGKREDMLRIMNKPCRYIKRSALRDSTVHRDSILDYYRDNPYMQSIVNRFFADLRRAALLRPYLAIDYIRKTMGYDTFLREGKSREEQEMLTAAADDIQKTASGCHTLEEWTQYIHEKEKNREELKRKERLRKETEQESTEETSGVSLITMHGSKGLEYTNVFLPDVMPGTVPYRKAVSPEQVEEERRLFYVAMTRAKERLEILYAEKPSPFLDRLMKSPFISTTNNE